MQELKINEIEEISGGNMPEGSVGGDTIPPGISAPPVINLY